MTILKKIEYFFDYYFAWMFYNGNKTQDYEAYMIKKWKDIKKG
jgi:hypothetical protein